MTLGRDGGWGEWGGGGRGSCWLYVKSSVLVHVKMVENTTLCTCVCNSMCSIYGID